jgi:hypothetical protein
MHHYLAVATSDQINRYFSRFTPSALISAMWDTAMSGIPALLSHDSTRPIGWSHPFAVHFEPRLTRLVGVWLLPETPEESSALHRALLDHFAHELYEEHGADLERLRGMLTLHLRGAELGTVAECVALVEEGLAARACPQIFEVAQQDRDGLVPLGSLVPLGPGVFQVGELAIFAHPFFRRSMARVNTLNESFFDRLERVRTGGSSRVDAKIALDPDTVGLAATYRPHFEHEYWWGPRFDDDLTRIPAGITRHQANDRERIFHGISGAEFWWQSRDGQHIFEAEEIRDRPTALMRPWEEQAEDMFGCRYVHSIVDEATGEIFHFDGAVRAYPERQMLERLDSDIARFGRHSIYTKLWRVDGTIAIPDWKGLLSDYFRDNHLVGEYLGAPHEEIEPTVQDLNGAAEGDDGSTKRDVVSSLVPYSMAAGGGVRVVPSCSEPRVEYSPGRSIIPLDRFTIDGVAVPIVEADAIELRKALTRQGETLTISEGIGFLWCKDFYTNLPLIFHNGDGDELSQSLRATLDAMRTLVAAWNRNEYDLVAAINVGFLLGGREVRLSVFGHATDLAGWLDSPWATPPTTETQLREWAEGVSTYLRTYAPAGDHPPLGDTLQLSGLLHIDRQLLDPGKYQFTYDAKQVSLNFRLAIPTSEVELCEAVVNSQIVPVLGSPVLASTCSQCGGSYFACGCSKLLDDGVAQEITDAGHPFLFWTDRPVR